MSLGRALALLAFGLPFAFGCTLHHSRVPISGDVSKPPSPESRFVTEDDSGLLLFGLVSLSEPDHYAILVERARKRHRCKSVSQGQLDYYTDHWVLIGFPVARVTLLCEPEAAPEAPASK